MIDEDEGEIIQQDELSADLAAAWEETVEETDDGDDGIEQLEGQASPDDTGTDIASDIEASIEETAPTAESSEQKPAVDEAPSSLPPSAREAWKDTPKAMQDAIGKREREYEQGIMKYAQGAKQAEGMHRVVAPYAQYTQMNGGPKAAIEGLLRTGSALQMGSPIQKAEIVTQLIKQFGVDISTLDSMLVGQAPPQEAQQNHEVQQAVQQAVAPYQQVAQQMQQEQYNRQMQQRAGIDTELGQFASKNEFYEDVKMSMANLLDYAAGQGQNLSLDDAYNTACALNPEINTIRQSRTNTQSVQQKRKAASSISGSLGGPGSATEHDDMRDTISQAWANMI